MMRFFINANHILFLFTALITVCVVPKSSQAQLLIFDGTLGEKFVMGVNSHFGDRDWVEPVGRAMKMSYPGNQAWGSVYFTVGEAFPDTKKERRRTIDLSKYSMLSIELRGEKGGESIWIGMKDKSDPNNGTETKKLVTLSSNWGTYNFIITDFKTADLQAIHVPVEIIFGKENSTVYFRNVRFYR